MSTADIEPTQQVSELAAALAAPSKRITSWARKDIPLPQLPIQPGLLESVGPLLDIVGHYTANEDIAAFRVALDRGDRDALNALQHVVADSREVAPRLPDLAQKWFIEGNFQAVQSLGPVIATIAANVGLDAAAAVTLFVMARSFWKAGDAEQTIAIYELAIAAAEQSNEDTRKLRSASHDNMGAALSRLDRLDDAIRHFRIAEQLETDQQNRLQIRANLADACSSFGEYAVAVSEHRAVFAGLEQLRAEPLRQAVALDNWALALAQAGETEEALAIYERATPMIPADSVEHRRINNSLKMQAYLELGRYDEAAATFREIWDLALAHGRQLEVAAYRAGYRRALGRMLPPTSDAWAHLWASFQTQEAQQWEVALDHLYAGANIAIEGGDAITYLRCRSSVAGVLADARHVDEAWAECQVVQEQARSLGLALPMAKSETTMAAILLGGSDRGGLRDAIQHTARAIAYAELHDMLVAELNLPADHIEREPAFDLGVPQLQVGGYATTAHAYDLAERYLRDSIDSARRVGKRGSELNRKIALLDVLNQLPDRKLEADALTGELRQAIELPDTPRLFRLGILRALGSRGEIQQGLADLRSAATLFEELRADRESGSARSDLDQSYSVYPRLLGRLQSTDGPAAEPFAVLQAMRARRLMETLTARTGDTAPYRPPSVDEIVSLLGSQPRLTTFVDVTITATGLRAYLVDRNGVRALDVAGDVSSLVKATFGDAAARAMDAVAAVRNSSLLSDLAHEVTNALEPGSTVLLAVDDALSNLPLHAIRVGDSPWCEAVSIGRVPAAGALRFTPSNRTWTGRSIVAGNSAADLLGAAQECVAIGDVLGIAPIVGPACTFEAVEAALSDDSTTRLDLIHLAVHGRADPRRGGLSSLLFAGDPPKWIPFAALANLPWRANLIVFSGCSTAVGGPRNGAGLYGVAQAAAEAGATTVIASLWPVNDASAAIFMTAFYRELHSRKGAGLVDLRDVMDVARSHLRQNLNPNRSSRLTRNGRNLIPLNLESEGAGNKPLVDPELAAMIHWAPFVLMGEPTIPV